jgi:hypothetical protein
MKKSFWLLMFSVLLVPAAANAVTFGWQELPEGGIEYLVQVEPDLLDSFHKEGFASDIPKGLRDIRRIRIVVGQGRLPHQGDINGPQSAAVEQPAGHKSPDSVPPLLPQETRSEPPVSSQTNTDTNLADRGASDNGAPVAEAAHDFTQPLPFFQSGSAKHIHPMEAMPGNASSESTEGSSGVNHASPASAALETTEQPRLNKGEGGVSAGYGSAPDGQGDTTAAAAKPWLPLMGALLCLFASLAANVYLIWNHMAVRAKYQTLVRAGAVTSG